MNTILERYDTFITPIRDLEIRMNLFSRILKEHFNNSLKDVQNFVKTILGFDDFNRLNRLFSINIIKDWEWFLWGKKNKFSTKNFTMYPIKNTRWYEINDNSSQFSGRVATKTRYEKQQISDAKLILESLKNFMWLFDKFEKGKLGNE